jgi:hypothetical protein
LGFAYSNINKNGGAFSINTNLSLKYFINKNIAWTAHFLSLPIYQSEKPLFPGVKNYFSNSFAYYLK